jgi:hypothetical protein
MMPEVKPDPAAGGAMVLATAPCVVTVTLPPPVEAALMAFPPAAVTAALLTKTDPVALAATMP